MHDSDYQYLEKHRQIWANKPVLRQIYEEQFYRPLLENRAPGTKTLELGSGPGFMADIDPNVVRTDILPSVWITCAADAHALPFASSTFDNVLGLDVLHHFNRPGQMLREAARVLRPGGRLLMVEPWITPFSRFIYTYLHQENCHLDIQPWQMDQNQFDMDKDAFDGNAAIPYVLLQKGSVHLKQNLPELALKQVQRFSSFTYLLSGGFKPVSLLPQTLYPLLYKLERVTQPLWESMLALRALIIWEKQ